MSVLPNARHERFAQALASGMTIDDAYVDAGYSANRGNAARLNANEGVQARVREILDRGAQRAEITVERVLRELAKIGFSDIRKAIKWNGTLISEEDNADGGDVLVVKELRNNHVLLIDSEELDDDTAAAIAEVSQNATGGVKIKMHDKKGALVDIGRHLGMFTDKVDHTSSDGTMTPQPTTIRIIAADDGSDDSATAKARPGIQ